MGPEDADTITIGGVMGIGGTKYDYTFDHTHTAIFQLSTASTPPLSSLQAQQPTYTNAVLGGADSAAGIPATNMGEFKSVTPGRSLPTTHTP
jgi:hypothetical protein